MCMCGCRKGGSKSRVNYDISSDLRMNDILRIMNEQRMENDSDSDSESKSSVNVNVVVNAVGSENVLANDSSAENVSKDDLEVVSESENGDIEVEAESQSLIEDKSTVASGGNGDDDDDENGNGNGGEKVTICHNGQTLEVAESAVQAHLDHGDTLGPCEED